MIWVELAVIAAAGFVVGLGVGYRLKSHEAHERARRRRLDRAVARGQAASAERNEMPPRQSTADVRRTRH